MLVQDNIWWKLKMALLNMPETRTMEHTEKGLNRLLGEKQKIMVCFCLREPTILLIRGSLFPSSLFTTQYSDGKTGKFGKNSQLGLTDPPPRTKFRNVWNWEHIDGSRPPRIDIWIGIFALRRPYRVFYFFFYWYKKSYFD